MKKKMKVIKNEDRKERRKMRKDWGWWKKDKERSGIRMWIRDGESKERVSRIVYRLLHETWKQGRVMRRQRRPTETEETKDKLRAWATKVRGIYSLLACSISHLLEDFSPHFGCHQRKLDLQMCPLLLSCSPRLSPLSLFPIKFTQTRSKYLHFFGCQGM